MDAFGYIKIKYDLCARFQEPFGLKFVVTTAVFNLLYCGFEQLNQSGIPMLIN
jgi:hypothetical protein